MMTARESWTEEMFTKLRELYLAEQYSLSQLASILNRTFKTSFSRSSVISKLHRSGLVKEHPMRRPGRPTKHNNPKAKAIVVKAKIVPPTINLGACKRSTKSTDAPKFDEDKSNLAILLIDARDNQCRWPVSGEGSDLMVCGAPITHGSYCARHGAKNADEERRPRKVVYRRMFSEDATR